MAKIPVALQLYSVREDCQRDLAGTLARVAEMGYQGVEFAGFYDHGPEQIQALIAANGLRVAGAHIGIDTLLGDKLEATIDFHRAIGNRFLIVPGLAAHHRDSRESWQRTAGMFNDIASALSEHGMFTGYHNHTVEFGEMGGEVPWDTFFGNTSADVVMQLDTGNALHGGGDPVDILKRYPGRALTVHLKSFSAANPDALIGEDDVAWDQVFRLCEEAGRTEWYIIEHERYPFPPLECVERCLKAVRAMGR